MTSSPCHIEVAVALPVYNTYTYRVPQHLAEFASIGKRVLVPFGRRVVTAYILGDHNHNHHYDIKTILDILDETPLFPASMLPFFKWTADYYVHPIGDVIKCALPGGLNLYDYAILSITKDGERAVLEKSVTPLERNILKPLTNRSLGFKDLGKRLNENIPKALLQSMKRRGLIALKRELKGGSTRPKTARYVSLINEDIPLNRRSHAQKKMVASIKAQNEISVKNLTAMVPSAPKLIKMFEEAGYVAVFDKKIYRDPFGEPIMPDTAHKLTQEQHHAITTVIASLGRKFISYLLTGVTGSGKTEVYMQIAAQAVDKGFSVLVLVPEIALISQMERRFRARFGDCVAVLHSGLSPGERYDQWHRISQNKVNIAIGARSAIFAPFTDLGLIIVDEEHDTSYKQESGLKYNARDLAVVRAKLHNAVVLLGSATPSIQSYHNVKTKKFKGLALTKRVEKRPLPTINVIDLRKSREAKGTRRFITPELHQAMATTLERKEQVLLFLNRRGFASFPVCSACGNAIQCKNCDISLTLHQKANAYKCHYCGFSRASVSNCTHCGSSKISLLGLGTEKVETTIKALFPDATVARMDRDTTRRKNSIRKILKDLRNQSIDILIGTQMVAKGHDFPNITLVGIICADLSLNFPDFRAGERTYQLLAQVAGRAGRGEVPGSVILQTYNPDHFSILSATKQDFAAFYNAEIAFRKSLAYPPFSRMVQLKISGTDKDKTRHHARVVGDLCHTVKKCHPTIYGNVDILGPIEALLSKIARRYRWQIMLKSVSVKSLHQFIYQLWFKNKNTLHSRSVNVALDVDPFFMM